MRNNRFVFETTPVDFNRPFLVKLIEQRLEVELEDLSLSLHNVAVVTEPGQLLGHDVGVDERVEGLKVVFHYHLQLVVCVFFLGNHWKLLLLFLGDEFLERLDFANSVELEDSVDFAVSLDLLQGDLHENFVLQVLLLLLDLRDHLLVLGLFLFYLISLGC